MMDGVMNLCRVKFRDHQRLTRQALAEYSVPTYQGMGDVPRAGNDSGGGQLGNAIHCKPHGANDWLYVVVQEAVWTALANRIGPDVGVPDLANDPRVATIAERRKNQSLVWTLLNKFAEKYTKRELMAILNPLDVPCGPIMSTEDLATDEHVRGRDMWVELDHPQRGKWFNVGMPIKLSASPAVIKRSPTLGEHTDEVLKEVLGYDAAKIERSRARARFPRRRRRQRREFVTKGFEAPMTADAAPIAADCTVIQIHRGDLRQSSAFIGVPRLNFESENEDRNHRPAGLRQSRARSVPRARRHGRGRVLRAGEGRRQARSA